MHNYPNPDEPRESNSEINLQKLFEICGMPAKEFTQDDLDYIEVRNEFARKFKLKAWKVLIDFYPEQKINKPEILKKFYIQGQDIFEVIGDLLWDSIHDEHDADCIQFDYLDISDYSRTLKHLVFHGLIKDEADWHMYITRYESEYVSCFYAAACIKNLVKTLYKMEEFKLVMNQLSPDYQKILDESMLYECQLAIINLDDFIDPENDEVPDFYIINSKTLNKKSIINPDKLIYLN